LQATTEIGPVYSFAGRGKQHLLDQIADVITVIRLTSAATRVEMKWKIDVHQLTHIAVTRVCVTAMINGVPVGAQIAWLSSRSNGCPFESTRVAEVTNCAVTQGPFAAGGGGKAQPATTYGAAIVTVG
jgi:hypothetical protein